MTAETYRSRLRRACEMAYYSKVRIPRRVTALVLQCALLATSLVGSGFICGAERGAATHMAMGDMSMPDMPSHSSMPDGDQAPKNPHSDCTLPWALGAGCQSMTSCAPTAISGDVRADAPQLLPDHDAIVWRANQLRSVTRSPEPPPPRA